MNTWWGYKHVNGGYQAKRYFDAKDLVEAENSDFVDIVIYPFPADTREDALEIVEERSK
jgi:hypothetical protein